MLDASICRNINVYRNFVYYINKSEDGKICRINIESGIPETICNRRGDFVNMVEDYIYFCNKSDSDKLYRIAIDGGEPEAAETGTVSSTDDDWFSL